MEIGKIRHIGIETDIHERRHVESSVTRFGNFWNFLATNFIIKVAQIVWCFWAVVKLFKSNWLGYLLLENLCYFLFQHLVTLVPQESNV